MIETDDRLVTIGFEPGIRRDASTSAEPPTFSDGTWTRFNSRALPEKIKGYRLLAANFAGIPRQMHTTAMGSTAYMLVGHDQGLEQRQLNIRTRQPESGVFTRTPGSYVAGSANVWTFAQMYNPAGSNSAIFAHAAPNLTDISSLTDGQIYIGAADGTGTFATLGISPPLEVSGGIVTLHPFLFAFGNYGTIAWSDAADPTTVGTSQARITEQKIVAGKAARGAGRAPSGLFWSLNSLIRAQFTGGTGQFSFDTITDKVSVLSPRGIIEHEGVFYWLGVDSIYQYTGVVQNVPNSTNSEDFFDNINRDYSQKVWAARVPRYGEIWWFYPRGSSTECNHALIYNARLSRELGKPVWYDTVLPPACIRTAGVGPDVYPLPVWACGIQRGTNGYVLFEHETGVDAVEGVQANALPSSITTSDFRIPQDQMGLKASEIRRLEVNMRQVGMVTIRHEARAATRSPPVIRAERVDADTTFADALRLQGRLHRIKIESNEARGSFAMEPLTIETAMGDQRPAQRGKG